MATPRDIRRLALRALLQLDAQGEGAGDVIRASLVQLDENEPDDIRAQDPTDFRAAEIQRAYDLALSAHRDRFAADQSVAALAPTWPAHRQPAVDRAIVRLAHYEMTHAVGSPKASVNEAVELAKRYSTERSPAFVNAVLDKVLKRVLAGEGAAAAPARAEPDAGPADVAPGPAV